MGNGAKVRRVIRRETAAQEAARRQHASIVTALSRWSGKRVESKN